MSEGSSESEFSDYSNDESDVNNQSDGNDGDEEECKQASVAVRSKNELDEKQLLSGNNILVLPPNPKLVTIGKISSLCDSLVVVESTDSGEQMVLDLDTPLILKGNQRVLGRISDVFGPVTRPLYSILFKSPQEALAAVTLSNDSQNAINSKENSDNAELTSKPENLDLPGAQIILNLNSSKSNLSNHPNNSDEKASEILKDTQSQSLSNIIGLEVCYCPDLSSFVFTQALKKLKGSDASNIYDEEVGEDEVEFSDDEQEALFKATLKRKRKGSKIEHEPHEVETSLEEFEQENGYNAVDVQDVDTHGESTFASDDDTPKKDDLNSNFVENEGNLEKPGSNISENASKGGQDEMEEGECEESETDEGKPVNDKNASQPKQQNSSFYNNAKNQNRDHYQNQNHRNINRGGSKGFAPRGGRRGGGRSAGYPLNPANMQHQMGGPMNPPNIGAPGAYLLQPPIMPLPHNAEGVGMFPPQHQYPLPTPYYGHPHHMMQPTVLPTMMPGPGLPQQQGYPPQQMPYVPATGGEFYGHHNIGSSNPSTTTGYAPPSEYGYTQPPNAYGGHGYFPPQQQHQQMVAPNAGHSEGQGVGQLFSRAEIEGAQRDLQEMLKSVEGTGIDVQAILRAAQSAQEQLIRKE